MLVKFLTATAMIFSPIAVLVNSYFFTGEKIVANTSAKITPIPIVNEIPWRPGYNPFLEAVESGSSPVRNWNIAEPEFNAKAVLALTLDEPQKFLYQKNIDEKLSIASLSKLMTALVVYDNVGMDAEITVSQKAVATYGLMGGLAVGEKIKAKDLLYVMLVESSNDAAIAFKEYFQTQNKDLVALMNDKARSFDLKNTSFEDPTGLSGKNVSTARELSIIAKKSLVNPLISKITRSNNFNVHSVDGKFKHTLENSNKLLGDFSEILLGKTGNSEDAGECLLMVLPSVNGEQIFYIVLASTDRFGEMKSLINWTKQAYLWY